MNLIKNTKFLLFLIVVLGFLLRFVGLESNPPSLNWDEVSHGYNAYSILKTGMDEWGQKFPLSNFRAYGDYPLPLNLYLTIPFILFFGLTEFSIRIPHVLLGTLTILTTFYLAWGLTKNRNISILSALLVAVSPWTLFTSRFVLQSNLSIFLLTLSIALFLNRNSIQGIKIRSRKSFVTLSFLFLGLSLYAYNTTRIIAPLILSVIYFLYKGKIWSFKNLLVVAIFFLPIPFILLNSDARARNIAVAIVDQGAVNKIESQRNNSELPEFFKKVVYNRPVYFAKEFVKNYVGYFSPQFLFLKGGTQYQFSVPNYGLLPWVNLPLFYIGLYVLFRKVLKKDLSKEESSKDYMFMLAVLLLAPIPAAMTNEKYAVLRSSAMIPIPMILSSIGFYYLYEFIKDKQKTFYTLTYSILLVVFCSFYLVNYFTKYKLNYSQDWQYGYKEVAKFIEINNDNYAKIIMTKKYGEPHEFLLFYLKFDPKRYMNDQNLNRFNQSNWWWVDGFDKFYFVNDWQIPKEGYKFVQESKKVVDCKFAKCLLVTSPNNAPINWKKIDTVNFLDGRPAFELYENN